MKLRLAVVQFKTRKLNPPENLEFAEKFIAKASKAKAEIIIFPEAFLSRRGTFEKKSVLSDEHCINELKEFAKRYSIAIVAPMMGIIRGKKYNVCNFIDDKGKILAKYKKEHLWITEKGFLKPGKKLVSFKFKGVKVGLIICWDLIFPEVFRKFIKKNVELVIAPSNWSYEDARQGLKYDKKSEIKLIDALCVERAYEEEMILAFCNTAGKVGNSNSIGHSQITEPFKGSIKKLNHNKEKMFIKEIDTHILRDAEKAYCIEKDLKNRLKNIKNKKNQGLSWQILENLKNGNRFENFLNLEL